MSIDPVQGSKPGIELKTPEKNVRAAPVPPSAASGNTPKAEIVKPQIAPIQPLIPEHEVPPEDMVRAAPVPPSAASGNTPKAEIVKPQIAPIQPLIPEHEVQLQLDTAAGDVIVYRVLDKQSGSLRSEE